MLEKPNKIRIALISGLAIGAVAGFQHDSVSQGLGTIWKIGQESGLYDTFIRTDTQLITKKKLPSNAKNLDYFDAVFFNCTERVCQPVQAAEAERSLY